MGIVKTFEAPEINGYIEGATVSLTSDNDALGIIMFGECWPDIKQSLAESEGRPASTYTMRVTKVSKSKVTFSK